MKNQLSIITINYNNINGLKNTVQSVINQSWKEFEYIIIDGGSTDGSAEYILGMEEHFSYWICETDNGIYNAMNKGVQRASGNYVYFLNSGDCLVNSSVLENVFVEVENVNGKSDEPNIFLGSTKQNGHEHWFNPPEMVTLYHLYNTALPHQGVFLPKSLAKKFPFNEEFKIVSDWIQSIEILLSGLGNFINLKEQKTIAINEKFGISSTQLMDLEKALYISRNEPLFSIFNTFGILKQTLKNYKRIISSSLFHRFCWKLMCLTFKK